MEAMDWSRKPTVAGCLRKEVGGWMRLGEAGSGEVEDAAAVTDFLGAHAHAVEHGEVEVGHWRFTGKHDALAWGPGAACFAGDENG